MRVPDAADFSNTFQRLTETKTIVYVCSGYVI